MHLSRKETDESPVGSNPTPSAKIMKYLTFDCSEWDCSNCPTTRRVGYCDTTYPIVCQGNCVKCPVRFLCFTTRDEGDSLVVPYETWRRYRRKWSLFKIDKTMTMCSDGVVASTNIDYEVSNLQLR